MFLILVPILCLSPSALSLEFDLSPIGHWLESQEKLYSVCLISPNKSFSGSFYEADIPIIEFGLKAANGTSNETSMLLDNPDWVKWAQGKCSLTVSLIEDDYLLVAILNDNR